MAPPERRAIHASHDRRRIRTGSVARALVPALVLVLALLAAPSAAADVACSFDAGTGTVTITFADDDDITIGRSADDVVVNSAVCTGATVTTTDTIHVAESVPDGDDLASLTIDLSGGPLAPGKTDEGDGSSEIELTLGDDADGWKVRQLIVIGSRENDMVFVGALLPDAVAPIELNGDESTLDWDVTGRPTLYPPITVHGGPGDDELRGAGDDIVHTDYALTLMGGDGNDLLVGSDGSDQIDGGPGTDTVGTFHQSWIDLSSGVATSDVGDTDGLSGLENIRGSSERDWLTGDDGPNRIDGAGGSWDVIAGGGGDDQLIGGEGAIDTVDFSAATNAIEVDVIQGTATGEGNDTIEGIEWVVGSPYDDHVISAPWVYWVHAGEGDDVVHPVAPNFVYGEGGVDTLDLSDAAGPVTYDMGIRRLTIDGHRAGAEGFETVIGSRFADAILGIAGAEEIVGGRGADELDGSQGADVLLGKRGRDVMHGGPDPDGVYGGRGDDRILGGGGVDTCFGGPGEDVIKLCEVMKRPAE